MVRVLTLESVYLKVRKLRKKVRVLKKRNPEIEILKSKVSRLEKRLNKLTSNEDLDELISLTSNANTVEIKIEPGFEIKSNYSEDLLEVLNANILVPTDTEYKIEDIDSSININSNVSCFEDLIKIGLESENNSEKTTAEPENNPNDLQNVHFEGTETENMSFGSICNENFVEEGDYNLDNLSPSLNNSFGPLQMKEMSVVINTLKQSEIQKYFTKTKNDVEEIPASSGNDQIDKPYICKICQKSFISPILFQRHHHLMHTPKTPKSLKNDSNSTPSSSTISSTINKDSSKKKSPCIKCKFCHQKFATIGYLKRHSKVHADSDQESIEEIDVEMDSSNVQEESTISCEMCNIYFKNQHYKNVHINLVHPELKKIHMCKICNKKFKSESTLRRHSVIHSADRRPFNCSICQKNFKRKDHLAEHNRSIHLGIHDFECTICSKSFFRKSSLEKHQLGHTSNI